MGLDHDGRIVSLVLGHSSPLPFRFRFFEWYCFDIVLQCSKTSLGRQVREGIRELIAWPSKSKVKIVLIIENLVVKVRLMNWSPEMAAQSHHDFTTTTTTIMPQSGFSLNPTLHWSLLLKKAPLPKAVVRRLSKIFRITVISKNKIALPKSYHWNLCICLKNHSLHCIEAAACARPDPALCTYAAKIA